MDTKNRPYVAISEIAQRWGKNPKSVVRAIDSRHNPLQGYQSPDDHYGTWFIAVESVIKRWGMPKF